MLTLQFDTPEATEKFHQLASTLGEEQATLQVGLAKLRQHYASHFSAFCRHLLGYTRMIADHDQLCAWMQQHQAHPRLILMPRSSFKSSLCTISYVLWKLLKNPNLRILIYSDTTEKAERFLLSIKNHILGLEGNGAFRQLTYPTFWEVNPQEKTWNQSAIVIAARTQAHFVPSVDVAGIETSKAGMHYDLIIFDDIVTDRNITTLDQMDKVENCYQDALSLLIPGGEMVMVGTRWHAWELYGRILARDTGIGRWQTYIRDGEVGPDGAPFPYAAIGLTQEFLAQQKSEQGTAKYSCLYRMSPQDDETAIFKSTDFRFYQPAMNEQHEAWRSSLYITCVLDPIPPPTSDHGDDAAITVVGTDHEHTLFLLEAVAGRLTVEQQIQTVLHLHERYHFRVLGVETNAFQRMIRVELERRLMERRSKPQWQPFSIKEFVGVTQGNKEQRIQGLQPWHERGAIRFPGTKVELLQGVWSQLAYQMLQFPRSQKDDLVDSLAYHLQLIQRGSERPQITEFPWSSAAWFERRQRQQMLGENGRANRWERHPIPTLAFS